MDATRGNAVPHGSESAASQKAPPGGNVIPMEKRPTSSFQNRWPPNAPQVHPGTSVSSKASKAENPFLTKYRLMSLTNREESPDALARTYSNLSVNNLEKARDVLQTGGGHVAKIKYDQRKRSARMMVGESAPQLPIGGVSPMKGTQAKPPKNPSPPLKVPPVSRVMRNQAIQNAPDAPVPQPVAISGDPTLEVGQHRLSFRSAPHTPNTSAGVPKGAENARSPSFQFSDRPGSCRPASPGSPSLQSKSIASLQSKKDAAAFPAMEDVPSFGQGKAPETRPRSVGRAQKDGDGVPILDETVIPRVDSPYSWEGTHSSRSFDAPNQRASLDTMGMNPEIMVARDTPPMIRNHDEETEIGTAILHSGASPGSDRQTQPEMTMLDIPDVPYQDEPEPKQNSDPNTQPERFDGIDYNPVVIFAEEEKLPTQHFQRHHEWVVEPSLLYLFANLIELQELKHFRYTAAMQESRKRTGSLPSSLLSTWDVGCENQLLNLQKNVSFAVYEVDGILLNKFFVSWTDKNLRSLVSDVTDAWNEYGSESAPFNEAAMKLIDAISEDDPCIVSYTHLYSLRKRVGDKDNKKIVNRALTLLLALGLICTVLLTVFAPKSIVAQIVLSIVLGLDIIAIYGLAMLLAHHNAYAEASDALRREKDMARTMEVINQDDDIDRSFREVSSRRWSALTGSEDSFVHPTPDARGSPIRETRQKGAGARDDGFVSMIGVSMQTQDPEVKERLERDRQNALLMTNLNYAKQQQSMQFHQEQVIRQKMDNSPLLNDANPLTFPTTGNGTGTPERRASVTADVSLVAGLSQDINITALLWCQDNAVTTSVMTSLWQYNFLVICGTLPTLEKVYHNGSERFKVFLIHAADLVEGTSEYDTTIGWVLEKRPVFFFSNDVRSFPTVVPLPARLELPFSERDMYTILLSGIGVDEEVSSSPQATQPFRVPPYTLGRRLGGGAYGNVFEAEMEETGGKCAVKRIYLKNDESDGDSVDTGPSSQLREIAQEVEIMSSLAHPNIVKYMFCERDDNCISIFMELCSGGSLTSLINDGELTDPTQVKRVLSDIIGAVAYLHKKRIVHRDLKPDNVLFGDGRAKVTDFGTAVLKRERGDLRHVKGTFAYMAPEILCGEPYGKTCDVWSIGCIAAEVLYVKLPQRSLGLPEMCEYYRKMAMHSSLEIDCEVTTVKDFLCACLQRSPDARMSAEELLQHEMLRPESTALDRWMQTAAARRLEDSKAAGAHTFAMDGSAFDLNSEANDSLRSSESLVST